MKRSLKNKLWVIALAAGLLLLLTLPALAQSGGGYDLSWSTVDAGGGTFSTGGSYVLGGSIGQPDAGRMVGGDYSLAGGFWAGGALQPQFNIYLPLLRR